MSTPTRSILDRIRQPEYTGENRCTPCTLVNLTIAGLLALAAAALLAPVVGVGLLVVAVAAISLRGYLVPGTPTLTKRYLPDVVLRAFEHEPSRHQTNGQHPVDLESVLVGAGIVSDCADGEDLCLTEDFRWDWYDRIHDVRTRDHDRKIIATLLDVDPDRIRYRSFGDAFVMLVDDRRVGTWESSAAFYADVAGAELLPERIPGWDDVSPPQRADLLASLRLFLEECPDCGAPVRMAEDVVESCCREIPVVAVECTACEARLFEVDHPGAAVLG